MSLNARSPAIASGRAWPSTAATWRRTRSTMAAARSAADSPRSSSASGDTPRSARGPLCATRPAASDPVVWTVALPGRSAAADRRRPSRRRHVSAPAGELSSGSAYTAAAWYRIGTIRAAPTSVPAVASPGSPASTVSLASSTERLEIATAVSNRARPSSRSSGTTPTRAMRSRSVRDNVEPIPPLGDHRPHARDRAGRPRARRYAASASRLVLAAA